MDSWNEYWSMTPHKQIINNPPKILYGGTYEEPAASIGMSCFLDAVRDEFVEGFSVIDYGCGAGILANFISGRLQDFNYYGLEPNSAHGMERIKLAHNYLADSRCTYGYIESDYEKVIKNKVDAVILISIFTHLIPYDIVLTLDNLIKVFDANPKASIVFSCFIDHQNDHAKGHLPAVWSRFYDMSYITVPFLQNYCISNGLSLTHHTTFIAFGGHQHQIYKITKL